MKTDDCPPSVEETASTDTLLEFPCNFPVKVMGRKEGDFVSLITHIVLKHAKIFEGGAITTNSSGAGNFISITIPIEAQSKAQLDRIYQDLTGCKLVLVAL